MRIFLTPLLQLQRFFIPVLLILLAWAIWRTVVAKDRAVGLALYACLVVVVDGFYNTGIFIPGIEKGSIRFSEACALFLLAQPKPRSQVVWPSPGVLFLIGSYFALMLVSALRADPLMQGIMDFRRIMIPQLLALALALRGFENIDEYRRFLTCLTVLVLIVGVFCFWDVFFDINVLHSDMLYKPEYFHNRRLGRFGSILLNPNLLGAFVVLLFSPLLALFLKGRTRVHKAYLLGVLLALLFCLIQTQSRAPLAAFAGAVALFILGPVGGISRSRRFAAAAMTAVFLAIAIPGFLEHATERFDSLDREETVEAVSRASTWKYTRMLIAEAPLLGVGFGESQFLAAMATTDFEERFGMQSLDNPHNSYLQAAVYAGIPAVAAFLLANLVLLIRAFRASRAAVADGHHSAEIFGLAVGLTGFLVCAYPDMHLFTANLGPLYWLFCGLLLSLVTRRFAADAQPEAPVTTPLGPRQRFITAGRPKRGTEGVPPARGGSPETGSKRPRTSVQPRQRPRPP